MARRLRTSWHGSRPVTLVFEIIGRWYLQPSTKNTSINGRRFTMATRWPFSRRLAAERWTPFTPLLSGGGNSIRSHDRSSIHTLSRSNFCEARTARFVYSKVTCATIRRKRTLHLVYEAYETMALKKLEEIGIFVRQAWDIDSIAMIHRLGHLNIGETSVAVIVTSAHRRAAFDACHYAIDKLKKIVPIWKKEFFEDGEIWIEGQ